MTAVADLVRASIDSWNADLERSLFDTVDPIEIAVRIEAFCAAHLGAVADGTFYRAGVGAVIGVKLRDGRRVVVKVHRWNVSLERLAGVQRVQAHLATTDVPAPPPIGEPRIFANGIATVEEHRPSASADGHDPAVRQTIAAGLCHFIQGASDLVDAVDVGRPLLLRPVGADLWPEPHSARFDFTASASGAGWIDALAEEARGRLAGLEAPDVIGHLDWRTENLGFDDEHLLSAIYDWDSVAQAPEPVVVGAAASAFCTDWGTEATSQLPRLAEMQAFVADYEQARGRPFSASERSMLDAANLFTVAYGARCQHSDRLLHPQLAGGPDDGWAGLLRERGHQGLDLSTAP